MRPHRERKERMTQKYDVIIIGSGPNGLAIAAYLSKAGQKVLLLEKRFEAGGGLCTEQVTIPEFYHNTHAIYMMMVDYAPVYPDFQFEERYGVKHIWPDLQIAMPLSDGRCLCLYRDVEKTCASLAKFSQKDADAYRDMHAEYKEYMEKMLGPQTYVPIDPAPIMAARAEMTELGRKLGELAEKISHTCLCEVGKLASAPVLATLEHYEKAYLEHIEAGGCGTDRCKQG